MNTILKLLFSKIIFFSFVLATPLHRAVGDGDLEKVELILSMSVAKELLQELDDSGYNSLHRAAMVSGKYRYGYKIVKKLVEAGAELDALYRPLRRTSLHLAVLYNNPEAVRILFESGAAAACRDTFGRTTLHLAAEKGNLKVIHPEFWIFLHVKDDYGWTPLHLAAFGDHVSMVCLLILKGADENDTDKEGRTPKDIAEEVGSERVLKLLNLRTRS